MSKGFSFESFGAVAKTSKDTLYEWVKKYPEFADAKNEATSFCRMFWERLGVAAIISRSEHQGGSKSLNSAVWIFNMKNRFGWRDKQPDEVAEATVHVNLSDPEVIMEMLHRAKKNKNVRGPNN